MGPLTDLLANQWSLAEEREGRVGWRPKLVIKFLVCELLVPRSAAGTSNVLFLPDDQSQSLEEEEGKGERRVLAAELCSGHTHALSLSLLTRISLSWT